jgi:hypothetical protein
MFRLNPDRTFVRLGIVIFFAAALVALVSPLLPHTAQAFMQTPVTRPAAQQANPPAAPAETITFQLHPNPAMLNCLAQYPNKPRKAPKATVTVRRGNANDIMLITLQNIKPNLAFDVFTVQRSNLDSNGNPVAGFTNFGLAWYQSDLHALLDGTGSVKVKTILLDQIFGFDPDKTLAPLNTFHVGFWFNSPTDAAPCGFNGTTPFNGEHNAGPVAMISVPDAVTTLGPLCTHPSGTPGVCNP